MSASLKVVKSAGLLLTLQVVQRGLGIISTLILARLLTPEHFGIVALVTIALNFFDVLVQTGNQQYIIQKEQVDEQDLNTAWSLDVAIKSTMALLIIVCSPAISTYFETPELTLALSVGALALPIRALKTPGMMLLARNINYRPVFKLTLWQKGLAFVTVITIAVIEPSHWAIIIGNLVSAFILAAGSYRVHSYRPSWTFIRARKQWNFSQWLLMRGVVGFTRSQIDNLFVSKLFGTSQLGGYNLVREVALLPALSAILPMSEPLLAAIAQGKHDTAILAYRIRLSLALMITALVPLTTFIMLYPELIITVLLGKKWEAFAPLLQPFGLFFFTFCLFELISDAVIALGKVKMLFWFDVISTVSIIVMLYLWGTTSLENMAWLRGWLAVTTTGVLLAFLSRQTGFRFLQLAYLCLPVVFASAIAAWSVSQLSLTANSALPEFLIRGSSFVALTATLTIIFAWLFLRRREEWQQVVSLTKSSFI
ncbi:oligosaccharide flippase family protein [Marinobacter salsuginis]|uniref:Lipopolysaccharide biosynthesis protein n=1 Tax=Marinobacter salsuginis TaxID=418719 RepID=A0A5M3Q596_9GAMM|nr:oligosaccharide flippase family protein [Marinobacter salsuginis]GBO90154.1 lipopolysaccharide biosynthesis protein [Marinobacter salsuginis]